MGLENSASADMADKHPRFRAVEEPCLAPGMIAVKSQEGLDLLIDVSNIRVFGSDGKEQFPSGSVRDSRVGKGRYDLLPPAALKRVAIRFEEGAEHYGCRNWEKGQPLGRYLDSAIRHCLNRLAGMDDEDHLAAAAFNILAAMQTEEWIKSGKLPVELGDI